MDLNEQSKPTVAPSSTSPCCEYHASIKDQTREWWRCGSNSCSTCLAQCSQHLTIDDTLTGADTMSMIKKFSGEVRQLQLDFEQDAKQALQNLRKTTLDQLKDLVHQAFPHMLSSEQVCEAFDGLPDGEHRSIAEGLLYHNVFSHKPTDLHEKVADFISGRYKYHPGYWVERDHANLQFGWELDVFKVPDAGNFVLVELSPSAYGRFHLIKHGSLTVHTQHMFNLAKGTFIIRSQIAILKGAKCLTSTLARYESIHSPTTKLAEATGLIKAAKAPNSWKSDLRSAVRGLRYHLQAARDTLSEYYTTPGLLRSKVSELCDVLAEQLKRNPKEYWADALAEILRQKYAALPIMYALLLDLEPLFEKVEAGSDRLDQVKSLYDRAENSCAWAAAFLSREMIDLKRPNRDYPWLNVVNCFDPEQMIDLPPRKWKSMRTDDPDTWFIARMQLKIVPLKDVITQFVEYHNSGATELLKLAQGNVEDLKAIRDVLFALEVIQPVTSFRGWALEAENPLVYSWITARRDLRLRDSFFYTLPSIRAKPVSEKAELELLRDVQNTAQNIVLQQWQKAGMEPNLLTRLRKFLRMPDLTPRRKELLVVRTRSEKIEDCCGEEQVRKFTRRIDPFIGAVAPVVATPLRKTKPEHLPSYSESISTPESTQNCLPFGSSSEARAVQSQFTEEPIRRNTPKEKTRGTPDPAKLEQHPAPASPSSVVETPQKLLFTDKHLFSIWTDIFPPPTKAGSQRGGVDMEDLRRVLVAPPLCFKETASNGGVGFMYHRPELDGYGAGNLAVHAPHGGRMIRRDIIDCVRADLRKEFGWTSESFAMGGEKS